MGGEKAEPDIFVRILNQVDKIDGVVADVREIKVTLASHSRILGEHGKTLGEHDRRFDRIDQTLREHGRRFDRIDQTLADHTLRLEQVSGAVIDLNHDMKRHTHDAADLESH